MVSQLHRCSDTAGTSMRCALLMLGMAAVAGWEIGAPSSSQYSRADFPPGFVFGSGTSAYQVEGAAAEDGRAPSIWDVACHAGKIVGRATGDVACDEYHRYKDDVRLMKETGLEAYRFSISWSRILPCGRGAVNPKGLKYYNNLINELISHGIESHVTLLHYDLPQALEDEYGGWLSSNIVEDFAVFADVCFREFGDRVSYWTTLNEPNVIALGAYGAGIYPPFRCSSPFGSSNCSGGGDSTVEPYIVAHNMLLAHASVASLYRAKYQATQGGLIGLNVFVYHFLPLSSSAEDFQASRRAYDFYTGWFVEPLTRGDYPDSMKERTTTKMPSFTALQREQVKGSFDFFGVNHYATLWVSDETPTINATAYYRDFFADLAVKITVKNKVWPEKFPITPYGMQGVLEYFKQVYGNPLIYIHENGYRTPHNSSLKDTRRVEYMESYIGAMLDAVRNGSNVRGYFTWSLMDLFELADGYRNSYGLYFVDFEGGHLTRRPKLSAHWYSSFLKVNGTSACKAGDPTSINNIICNRGVPLLTHA